MRFNNYTEFYNSIKDTNLSTYPTLQFFVSAVNNTKGGCDCNKNKRLDLAANKYASLLTDLTDPEKEMLKAKFGNVEFAANNTFYGKI